MTNLPDNQPPQIDPTQPYSPAPVPPSTPALYPAQKKGPSALKIILIIVGIFVGLVLIGIGVLSYGVYKFAKSANFTTNSQPVTEADLGVPLYPGAEQGKANAHMTIAGKDMLTASFLTSDAKEQVSAFYKDKLGPEAQSKVNAQGETFVLKKGEDESVIVTISTSPAVESGKTQIVIVHAKKAATPATQGKG